MTALPSRARMSVIVATAAVVLFSLGAGAPVASASATKCAIKLWDIAGIPYPSPIATVCLTVKGSGLVVNQVSMDWIPMGIVPRRICNSRAVITVNPPTGATSTSKSATWSGCRYIPISFHFADSSYFSNYGYLPESFPHGSVVQGRIEETDDNGRTWRTYKSVGGITITR